MSFVKDLLLGQEAQPARVEDVRSPGQSALGEQLASFLSGAIQQGGLPQFQGPTVAGLGGQEQQIIGLLDGILSGGFGGNEINQAQGVINRTAGGGAANPLIQGIASQPGVVDDTFASLGELVSGRTLDPNAPFIQNQIQAATRPIFEAFEDDLGNLTSAATQAGQFVQPGSSSPFELARARLQTGVANAIGDTSAGIVTQNLNRERDRQLNLTGLLGNTFESGENRALNAATGQPAFQRGQLGGLTDALNISALPRMITQLGLDRGLDQFNTQQGNLLNLLGLGLNSSAPQTVSIPGTEGSTGLLGGALQAGATALGGPLGGALAGAIL